MGLPAHEKAQENPSVHTRVTQEKTPGAGVAEVMFCHGGLDAVPGMKIKSPPFKYQEHFKGVEKCLYYI